MPSPPGTCASIDSSSLTKESWPPGVAGYPVEIWLGCQTKSPVLSPGCSLPLASVQAYCVSAMMIGLPNWGKTGRQPQEHVTCQVRHRKPPLSNKTQTCAHNNPQ